MREYKIALAGNPNCGKTTMFNDLTGSSQYVGNWPGVTVEKKEGRLRGHRDVIVEDLPGIYSLSPYTLEEVVSRNYLIAEQPDAILNLVDGSNLERNLYLTTQLCEVGVPMVLALNMMDVVKKNGDVIDTKKLGEAFGCEVIETSAVKGTGSREAAERALEAAQSGRQQRAVHRFSPEVEQAIGQIESFISQTVEGRQLRWYAVKLFERDKKAMEQLKLPPDVSTKIEALVADAEKTFDDDSESIITAERYAYIAKVMKTCVKKKHAGGALSVSDKIDRIVTNRWAALPIFVLAMWAVYFLSIQTVGTMGTDWVNDVLFGEWIPGAVGGFLESVGCALWLQSLILDGIIAGVGTVLGFLPQMLVLFLCLALLEDCGYMARIAFIMDRIFRRFGLSGKSFIPMLVSMGCGVPGVLASRTIENDKDRRMTIMTTTFIPCGAKLPVIALIAGALFHESSWVAPSAYFIGVAAIVVSGVILKKTRLFAGEPAVFVMELPAYHVPRPKGVLIHMWDRAKAFVKKAGTIIFLASALIWFLSNFGFTAEGFGMVEETGSMLAAAGRVIAPVFAPLGWGDWRMAVAAVSGLIAKENIIATLGILFGIGVETEAGVEIWPQLASLLTQVSAYSFLVFNLLCAPCFAAIGAIRREMGSGKWTWIAVGWQTMLAYAASFCIYQLGSLFTGAISFGFGPTLAILLAALFIWALLRRSSSAGGSVSSVQAQAKVR